MFIFRLEFLLSAASSDWGGPNKKFLQDRRRIVNIIRKGIKVSHENVDNNKEMKIKNGNIMKITASSWNCGKKLILPNKISFPVIFFFFSKKTIVPFSFFTFTK